MFSIEDKNLMKPLFAYDVFLTNASRKELNPDAFSREQFWSKIWCIENLKKVYGRQFNEIYILGGWYGTLAGLLLQDPQLSVKKVINLDLDQEALKHSKNLIQDSRYEARTADLNDLLKQSQSLNKRDLLICSICEHIPSLQTFNQLKPDIPIIFQSTNLQCDDHINTKKDIEEFQCETKQILNFREQWAGTLDLKWFKRFMIMGHIQKPNRFHFF